jgi:phage tail-like protein
MTSALHNRYWLLDGIIGWQMTSSVTIHQTAGDGYLTLEPLPGNALQLALQGDLAWPVALAARGKRLFAIDGSCDRIAIVEDGKIHRVRGIGGEGSAGRRLRDARGLAVLANGMVAVADTGNDRVQIFSREPHALLHIVDGFREPWGLAVDAQNRLLVADRGHGRVVQFSPGASELEEFGAGVLVQPTQLACSADGHIAVVDRLGVVAFGPQGGTPRRIELIPSPLSVAFDADGALYVGTGTGLIFKLLPDPSVYERYSVIWSGPVGDALQSSVAGLLWSKELGLVMTVHEIPDDPSLAPTQTLWRADPSGAFSMQGEFLAGPIDSGIENCTWHRAQLLATVAGQTTLQLSSYTSNDATEPPPDGSFISCMQAASDDNDPDCLVQSSPGQFIWLRIQLTSGGVITPVIRAIKVWYPRESYLQYLPAVYQQDTESRLFLDRFLSIFQAEFDGIDAQLDNLWQLFEPMAVTGAKFQWLASWLALTIDPTWTDVQRSTALKHAYKSYAQRGTIAGIQQAIGDYARVTNVEIIEDFKLRQWAALPAEQPLGGGVRLWSRGIYDRLQVGSHSRVGHFHLIDEPLPDLEALTWGANRFRVFFPADPYSASETAAKVQQVVEQHKPAHTEAVVHPILPRLRVGVQSTLGIDAAVGGVSYLVLSSTSVTNLSRLGYDTILACARPQREIESLGLAVRPRIGVNAAIL